MRVSRHRVVCAAVTAAALAIPLGATATSASAAQKSLLDPASYSLAAGPGVTVSLPAPPPPPSGPLTLPSGYQAPTALVDLAGAITTTITPPRAVTWGASGSATTLVVYDTTGAWGYLGELYALAAGNLAGHFGRVTAEPAADYVAGQVNNYTATIYIGSTYNEPLPTTFLNDVLATTHPVIWAANNVWQLSGAEGSNADQVFKAKYGWDASASYFDTTDDATTIAYKGQTFSRNAAAGADILAPDIVTPAAVSVLGSANCTDSSGAAVNCAPIAQSGGTSFGWAIRSANLTYVGEVPFSFISESDRYVAFSDLLFAALAPSAQPAHRALVRIEDVSPTSDPSELRQVADYLSSQNVPFSVGVIPTYTDPTGYYSGGTPQTITLAQAPTVVSALKYMQSKGGTILEHGYTHQYSTVDNPYDAVTGDDAEFYRARCSATQSPPYTFDAPCRDSDWIVWTGPLPGDSSLWASTRALTGRLLFTTAGLNAPTIWETPHYFASAADYAGIDSVYATRYERELFVGGELSGQRLDYSHIFGQFFPYVAHDVYGEKIIPENLGNYEPVAVNNVAPRLPADIVHNAQLNLAVTQGVASFFFHPSYPLSDLQQIVTGIKGLGYTFVSPNGLS